MRKEDIDSILLANMYLTLCKCNRSERLDIAKQFLNKRIKKALNRKISNSTPFNLYKIIFGVQ